MDPATQLARVPARPTRLDVGLVVTLLAWGVLEALTLETGDSVPVRLGFVVAVVLPLLWRRQQPVPVTVLVVAVVLLRGATAEVGTHGAAPFPSLLVLTFTVALLVRPPLPAAALGAAPGLAMAAISLQGYYGDDGEAATFVLVFFCGGAWALGRAVRRAADRLEDERVRSVELAAASVEAERARIARELHDVVAHAVSIVVVQAGAADAVLEKDPARAREHLRAVRRTGSEALAEMRHLLQVLREGEATYAPQPTLASLADLAADVTAAGTPVTLELGDDVLAHDAGVSAGVELCVYRVVQEALTNVRKHAPGAPTTVTVRRDGDALVVAVENGASGTGTGSTGSTGSLPGAGQGLAGMTERVRLYGGTLDAGPVPAEGLGGPGSASPGGFVVRARIPLDLSPALT